MVPPSLKYLAAVRDKNSSYPPPPGDLMMPPLPRYLAAAQSWAWSIETKLGSRSRDPSLTWKLMTCILLLQTSSFESQESEYTC